MSKTIVGLYESLSMAQRVVESLVNIGIEREDISLVANDATGEYGRFVTTPTGEVAQVEAVGAGAGVGAVVGGLGGLLLGLGALAIPGIGPVLAAGPLVTTLAGAGIGAVTGGLIGALVDLGIDEADAKYYAEGVRRGGTLVTVNSPDHRVNEVKSVMDRFNPIDMEERVAGWRQSGWSDFDERATPYTAEELTRERTTYQTSTARHTAMDDFDTFNADFRRHYDTNYTRTDFAYNQYLPAYRFGYDLAHDELYYGQSWDQLEVDARERWAEEYTDPWEEFKGAVRYAWERVKDAVTPDDRDYLQTPPETYRPSARP